jgi:hypothetical protein
MFSPRRPPGNRELCWILRDGLTDVFNHHHDAPQKTCSYTEEANANRLVSIFLRSSLFGWLRPTRAFGARDYLSELTSRHRSTLADGKLDARRQKAIERTTAATQPREPVRTGPSRNQPCRQVAARETIFGILKDVQGKLVGRAKSHHFTDRLRDLGAASSADLANEYVGLLLLCIGLAKIACEWGRHHVSSNPSCFRWTIFDQCRSRHLCGRQVHECSSPMRGRGWGALRSQDRPMAIWWRVKRAGRKRHRLLGRDQ